MLSLIFSFPLNQFGEVLWTPWTARTYYVHYLDVKLGKFQTICGTTNRTFGNKVRRDTKLKIYKVMALPVPVSYTHLDVYKRQSLYCPNGFELWMTIKKQDSKMQDSEMTFLTGVKRCSKLDRK